MENAFLSVSHFQFLGTLVSFYDRIFCRVILDRCTENHPFLHTDSVKIYGLIKKIIFMKLLNITKTYAETRFVAYNNASS